MAEFATYDGTKRNSTKDTYIISEGDIASLDDAKGWFFKGYIFTCLIFFGLGFLNFIFLESSRKTVENYIEI